MLAAFPGRSAHSRLASTMARSGLPRRGPSGDRAARRAGRPERDDFGRCMIDDSRQPPTRRNRKENLARWRWAHGRIPGTAGLSKVPLGHRDRTRTDDTASGHDLERACSASTGDETENVSELCRSPATTLLLRQSRPPQERPDQRTPSTALSLLMHHKLLRAHNYTATR